MIVLLHELADLALSHHPDDQLDRCLVVGGRNVCRRCSVLYPLSFLVMALVLAGLATSLPLMLVLPIPVTVEFVAEQLGIVRYDSRRQIVVTAIAAPALGMGFARVVSDRHDPWFWTMVGAHAIPCVIAWAIATVRAQRIAEAQRIAKEEADPVLAGFESADEFRAYLDETARRLGVERATRRA